MAGDWSDLFSAYSAGVQQIAAAARALLRELYPDAQEIVDAPSRIVAYGSGSRYSELVFAIAPHKQHVNLMFARGAALPEPDGLLEGTGKLARHVKLRRVEDVANPKLRALIQRALGE